MRAIGIVGWKNNGKTTLVVRLVEKLVRDGMRVSTIKHAHHSVEIDKPGKDTFRHKHAGASEVLLATSHRWALMHELREEAEPSLDELFERLSPCDFVIVEGFKKFPHPKIEVHLASRDTPLLAHEDPTIVAIASDKEHEVDIPVLSINDIDAVAELALARAFVR